MNRFSGINNNDRLIQSSSKQAALGKKRKNHESISNLNHNSQVSIDLFTAFDQFKYQREQQNHNYNQSQQGNQFLSQPPGSLLVSSQQSTPSHPSQSYTNTPPMNTTPKKMINKNKKSSTPVVALSQSPIDVLRQQRNRHEQLIQSSQQQQYSQISESSSKGSVFESLIAYKRHHLLKKSIEQINQEITNMNNNINSQLAIIVKEISLL